jgi:hypothetical protein
MQIEGEGSKSEIAKKEQCDDSSYKKVYEWSWWTDQWLSHP